MDGWEATNQRETHRDCLDDLRQCNARDRRCCGPKSRQAAVEYTVRRDGDRKSAGKTSSSRQRLREVPFHRLHSLLRSLFNPVITLHSSSASSNGQELITLQDLNDEYRADKHDNCSVALS
ncbi:hypothetical protein Ae201684P_015792 [Aphanomyces euteiches]|nr:hypothetical protein Ae201684P_015792 [Aphanomyces euteiches]